MVVKIGKDLYILVKILKVRLQIYNPALWYIFKGQCKLEDGKRTFKNDV
jgi:hypothetical protein